MNYIAFSLWGDNPIYNIGAVRNAELAKEIYPGWTVVVYHDNTVPQQTIALLNEQNVILFDMTGSNIYGPFWRFLVSDFPDSQYVVFRDTDSRLTTREFKAVEEWINERKNLHVMRDHPFHEIPFGTEQRGILAGMWGIKGGILQMESEITHFIADKEFYYGIDQAFLQRIYTDFANSLTIHDEFFGGKPFPEKRNGYQFVGERMDEHEQPMGDDRETLKTYLLNNKPSWRKRLKEMFRI